MSTHAHPKPRDSGVELQKVGARQRAAATLGARLRRLSERIDSDAARIHSDDDLKFEQRWFGTVHLLARVKALSVGEIAENVGIRHVSMSQTGESLENARVTNRNRSRRRASQDIAAHAKRQSAHSQNCANQRCTVAGRAGPGSRGRKCHRCDRAAQQGAGSPVTVGASAATCMNGPDAASDSFAKQKSGLVMR